VSPKPSRATVLVLAGLSAFGPLSLDLYLPALPQVAADLHASVSLTQLSLSGCLIGLAGGQLLTGPMSDRWGRRRPLLVGMTLWTVCSIACALAPNAWTLIVLRLLQGIGGAAGMSIARAIVRDLFEGTDIARIYTYLILTTSFTAVAAPVLGSQLLHLFSWRSMFVALAVIGVALTTCAWVLLPESLPPELRHTGGLRQLGSAVKSLVADRTFAGSLGVAAANGAVLFIYLAMGTFVLQDEYGLSAAEFGAVFAANSAGIGILGWISNRALRRFSIRRVLGCGITLMASAAGAETVAASLKWPLPFLLIPLFFLVGSIGLTSPTSNALALMGHARNAGTGSALMGASQFSTGALAGPLASAIGVSAIAMGASMLCWGLASLAIYLLVIARVPQAPAVRAPAQQETIS
jgi:DHA1 family bicyclomycin/chloramphenicol resistance-like MFS transporter